MASSQGQFISRDEYRTKKALDDLRKAGKMPAELDEEGKEINPHLPQYIIQAPWYLNQTQPSLKHHRARSEVLKTKLEEWYPRGIKSNVIVGKYRKGACENCGAITHKSKDCFERPRKEGAKLTGKDIQCDEYIQNMELDYDAKRDRWNGYDPDMYSEVIKEYEQYEQELKKKKQKELDEENKEDDYKIGDFENNADIPVTKKDPKTKTTIRNLRIREDPAKYLFNLDETSAHYDAKTRAMRENPNPSVDPEKQIFKGDNAYRYTGDTLKLLDQEKFVWDLIERNNAELNTIGLPSGTELLFKKMKEKEKETVSAKTQDLIGKYGGDEHLKADEGILYAQTEKYVEFGRDGKPKNAFDKLRGKSKYEEDKFINNHCSVWGSWWNEELGWGYICCFSNEKQSMCLREKGKVLALRKEYQSKKLKEDQLTKIEEKLVEEKPIEETTNNGNANNNLNKNEKQVENNNPGNVLLKTNNLQNPETTKNKKKKHIKKKQPHSKSSSESDSESSSSSSSESSSDSSSESSSDSESSKPNLDKKIKKKQAKTEKKQKEKLQNAEKTNKILKKLNPFSNDLDDLENIDKKKLKKALKEEQIRLNGQEILLDDRKRPFNSLGRNHVEEITKEEIEAYRIKKSKFDDPMNLMK